VSVVRLVVVAAIVCALCTPAARADGDPASDVLYGQRMFVPADASFPRPARQRLLSVLAASLRAGYPIKVAVIPSAYDLGSVGVLWGKPRLYARFLGIELSLSFRGRLLVVMPAGLGVYHAGKAVVEERRAIADVTVGKGAGALASTAIDAVRRLAAAGGHPLTSAEEPRAGSRGPSSHLTQDAIRGGLITLALCLLASLLWLLRRRLPRLGPARSVERPRTRRIPTRRLLWSAVALVGVCAFSADAMLLRAKSSTTAGPTAAPSTAPDTTWAPGQRRAPRLGLADTHGRSLSRRIGNGQITIVTFIDPLCRNLCPLEAQVIDRVAASLPPARRPQILAVSVNPAADTRANFRLDSRRWHLVPEWTWAIGNRAQLAAAWRRYLIDVQTIVQHAAGITVRKIIHTEAAYVVDARGFLRALFLWPYNAKTVTDTIDTLMREDRNA